MPQPSLCATTRKTALIALGANATSIFGAPYFMVLEAISRLTSDSLTMDEVSRIYRSPAFPAGSGPDFVNAVARLTTALSAEDLLSHLHSIEAALGRERHARWEARVIDLDLIDYDGQILPDAQTFLSWHDLPLEAQKRAAPDGLVLPHPRIQDRAFVLGPLCDVAPDWLHPVLGKTAKTLFDALPEADRRGLVAFEPPVDPPADPSSIPR